MLSLSDKSRSCSPKADTLFAEYARSCFFDGRKGTPFGVDVIEPVPDVDAAELTLFLSRPNGRRFTGKEGPAVSGRGRVSGMESTLKRCEDTWKKRWNGLLRRANEA